MLYEKESEYRLLRWRRWEKREDEKEENLVFMACDVYEDLCSTNKKIYLSMDIMYIFLIFPYKSEAEDITITHWKCKHPNAIKQKSFTHVSQARKYTRRGNLRKGSKKSIRKSSIAVESKCDANLRIEDVCRWREVNMENVLLSN